MRVVVELLIWETRGDSVAQRVQCGKVKVKHGLKTRAFLQEKSREDNVGNDALHVIGFFMGLVTRSLSS